MFIRFDTVHERDRHTQIDTQKDTQTPHDGVRIASRGKNEIISGFGPTS